MDDLDIEIILALNEIREGATVSDILHMVFPNDNYINRDKKRRTCKYRLDNLVEAGILQVVEQNPVTYKLVEGAELDDACLMMKSSKRKFPCGIVLMFGEKDDEKFIILQATE